MIEAAEIDSINILQAAMKVGLICLLQLLHIFPQLFRAYASIVVHSQSAKQGSLRRGGSCMRRWLHLHGASRGALVRKSKGSPFPHACLAGDGRRCSGAGGGL